MQTNTYMGAVVFKGILDNAVYFFSCPNTTSKVALYSGSSKHGNAVLASNGSKTVDANHLKIIF